MKKELLKQFETLIRGHIGEFYAKAYSVKGNRAEAEALTEEAIVWGASKFSGLANKERVIDLISARIGDGDGVALEPTDENALWARVMTKIRSRKKVTACLTATFTAVLAMIVGLMILWKPAEIPPVSEEIWKNFVVMDDTKTVTGDLGTAKLLNYHTISTRLGKKAKPNTFQDRMDYVGRMTAAVTTIDGTQYVVYHNIETEDGSNTTFSLYRASKEGWKIVGNGEVSTSLPTDQQGYTDFHQAWIHLVADEDSNVYTVTVLNGEVVVYCYDAATESFTMKKGDVPYDMNTLFHYLNVCYDESFGEKGAIYIGSVCNGVVNFYRYDIASTDFEKFSSEIRLEGGGTAQIVFDVKDDIVHFVANHGTSAGKLTYYRLNEVGVIMQETLFTSNGSFVTASIKESVYNRNSGRGGVVVDEEGNVHILTTQNKQSSYNIQYYHITPDGVITKTPVDPLYFDGGYAPNCAVMFEGSDGDIYYLETYRGVGVESVVAIGKLNTESGKFEYYESFELPDVLSLNRVCVRNNTFLFYTDQDTICYFCLIGEVEAK